MTFRGLFAASLGVVVLMPGFSSMAAEGNTDGGLPILVRVCNKPNFKTEYKKHMSYDVDGPDGYRKRWPGLNDAKPEDIRAGVTDELRNKLADYDPGGTLKPVFCETDDELREKLKKRNGYLCLHVMLNKRKELDTGFKLKADVELRRLVGSEWKQLIKTEIKSSYDKKKGTSDMSLLAEAVDAIMRKNIVTFEAVRSVSKDNRTKAIRLRVGNPTSFDVTMIKWLVPSSKSVLSAKSEGRLKPGAVVDIEIVVTSEGSHSAIQWRDVSIGEIRFAKPEK